MDMIAEIIKSLQFIQNLHLNTNVRLSKKVLWLVIRSLLDLYYSAQICMISGNVKSPTLLTECNVVAVYWVTLWEAVCYLVTLHAQVIH